MEAHRPHYEEHEKDPRVTLVEGLRSLALEALAQQRTKDADPERKKTAGVWYKTDGGFFKFHLQPPADDRIIFAPGRGGIVKSEPKPFLWVLIPLKKDKDIELETLIRGATDFIVQVEATVEEPIQFVARKDSLGSVAPIYVVPEDLVDMQPPDQTEQMLQAVNWAKNLEGYGLRIFVANNEGPTSAAVA